MNSVWKEKFESIREMERHYQKGFLSNFKMALMWIAVAVISGVVVGIFSSTFAYCLAFVTTFRQFHPWIVYLLPVGGLPIVLIYRVTGLYTDKGTNTILDVVHGKNDQVPALMAPVIYVATLITHLFGGSAGREGAALQMGGSLGSTIGRVLKMNERDRKIAVLCGMSAAFSVVFGTPLAAAVFPMEMVSVGFMQYSGLVPCAFASIIANQFAVNMGINPHAFQVSNIPAMSVITGTKTVFLGVLCAFLSIIFVVTLRMAHKFYAKIENPYVRIVIGGSIVLLLTLLLGTRIYNGASVGILDLSIAGIAPKPAFLIKLIMTALTLAAGFRGGEIVPAFCVGAAFGNLFGSLMGMSPALCAAVAMVSVFCGVTNCPIASMLIGFELFGFSGVPYILLSVSVSYMLSGYRGLYNDQIIMYSKFHPRYLNRISGEEDFDGRDYEEED